MATESTRLDAAGAAAQSRSLIVRGGRIFDVESGSLVDADVLIQGRIITDVARGIEVPDTAEVIDASDSIVIPGLINAHTHGQNSLIKGSVDAWTLEMLISFGDALNGNRTPDEQYVSAALSSVEMLTHGVTSAFELFIDYGGPHLDTVSAVLRAYDDVGLRTVVAPAVFDRYQHELMPTLGNEVPLPRRDSFRARFCDVFPGSEQLELMDELFQRYSTENESLVRIGIAPTIPLLCSDRLLQGCAELSERYEALLHCHLAETKFQATVARQLYGCSLVEHLSGLGVLSERFIGAHGIWVEPEDARRLAHVGSTLVHNPASNLKLGSGVASVRGLLELGVNVALGSDGCSSSDNLNMFEALRFAALCSRVGYETSSDWLTAADALDLLFTGGAHAMGLSHRIGALQPGCLADLALLDVNSLYLTPLNDAGCQLVYCETGEAVHTVIVDGRVVVRGGRVEHLDIEGLRGRAREAASRLRHVNRPAWVAAEEVVGLVERCAARTSDDNPREYLSLVPARRRAPMP